MSKGITYLLSITFFLFSIPLILAQTSSMPIQTGNISGFVKDKNTQQPVAGAAVYIDGTTIGTVSDYDGSFQISGIKPGKYSIVFKFISYNTIIQENIEVVKNKTTTLQTELEESSVKIQDVNVVAEKRQSSEISVINSIKGSNLLVSGISSQQIQKTQDRDASEVVKRIPGITVIDDRFIVVRGLAQRYNGVWLNNAATPSSEADVKAFSFDVIPSHLIDNLMIIKTPAPEIPADFAGGFIKISTKNMPEKNSITLSYSTSFNQATTFGDFYKIKGGKYDFLGFDDGTRSLPDGTPSHLNILSLSQNTVDKEQLINLSQKINKNWTAEKSTALPDQRFSIGINRKFNIGKVMIGNVTAFNYSNSKDAKEIDNINYSIYNTLKDQPSYDTRFFDRQFTQSVKGGILHNWSVFLGGGSKIEFRNLFNQISFNRTTFREGHEYYTENDIRATENRFVSRSTYSGQLGGSHSLKDNSIRLDWNIGYAFANKNEPDVKRYKTIRDSRDSSKYYILFTPNPDLSSVSRMFFTMKEKIWSGGANFSQDLHIGSFSPVWSSGFYFERKDRSFNARNIGYTTNGWSSPFTQTFLSVDSIFQNQNINLTNGIKMGELTEKSDSYNADNTTIAGYLALKLPISKWLNLYTGFRIENNEQSLNSYKKASDEQVHVNRQEFNIFPSANLTVNFSDRSMLRLAYGVTVNRPEFRELAPFYFVDFELNAGIYGNPDIKQAIIQHYDFRYEFYPSQNEMISLGLFYKNFSNPIEMVIRGNSPLQYSFENVKAAKSQGVEIELKKSLYNIEFLRDFSVVFNAAYIKSLVVFDEGRLERDRPMQGQSPFIINAGIFYQNQEKEFMVSLLYNIIGKRLMAVGEPMQNPDEDIPDIYEMPRHLLDLTISKKINKHFEIKAGIKDILNNKIIYKQTVTFQKKMDGQSHGETLERDEINKSYNPGRFISIGLTCTF
jgi:outer membrane receptor for ferrienterochelin and colicin